MINYHTLNQLSEKVYSMNDVLNDEVEINYEINSFFNTLMKRRRNDDVEEGLQASGVIYPDKAGFKICERNGLASHAHAQENASQYINGESQFSSEEAVGMIGSRRNDPNAWVNISKNGFTVRIVANRDMLIFIFNSNNYTLTEFQIDIIYKLFNLIKEVYQNKDIKYPYINFVTPKYRFVFNEFSGIDEQLVNLEEMLQKAKNDAKERARFR